MEITSKAANLPHQSVTTLILPVTGMPSGPIRLDLMVRTKGVEDAITHC